MSRARSPTSSSAGAPSTPRRPSSSRRPPARERRSSSSSAASCCSRPSRVPRRSPRSPSRARPRPRCAGASSRRSRRRARTRGPARPTGRSPGTSRRAALERNDSLGWRLEENSARLRVQTIDSLCASLTRQMPVLAKFGSQPESLEDAGDLYREAARATLALLDEDHAVAADVALVLAHLDNDAARVEELLAGLLRRRDHWLRYLRAADQRGALEGTLADIRREAVERAAAALEATGHSGPGGAGAVAADDWIAFANELLTKKGEWRKGPALAKTLAGDDRGAGSAARAAGVAAGGLRGPAMGGAGRPRPGRRGGGGPAQGGLRRARPGRLRRDRARGAARARHRGRADRPPARARLPHPPHPRGRVPGHLGVAERAAREAHRRVGARRRPHALRGGRPHAVDLPLPRGGGGPVPARLPRGHRRPCPSSRSRSRPTSARRRASSTG